jgi:LacI family transcriptional regulator
MECMASLKDPPQLPLFLNIREHWGRMIATGVARFARQEVDWTPFICDALERLEVKAANPAYGRPWAGLIGQFYPQHHALLESLCALGLPVVNVSGVAPPAGVGWVHSDDYACGAMAARHFLERGFRHFAFLGIANSDFSDERQRGFLETLGKQGFADAFILQKHLPREGDAAKYLAPGLAKLPAPCAVFACNDQRARHCLLAAKAGEIAVPEKLAILGVDDDELQCNIATVALSSVRPDWTRIGERAVEQLLRMVQAGPGQGRHEAIPPVSLSLRQSTDYMAVDDPLAGRALRRIRTFRGKRLTATDLAADLGVSRRTLERHLLKTLGTSIHALIQETRLRRAHKMILESHLSIGEIATRLGFSKQSDFNALFKKHFGRTPTSLRRSAGPPNLSRKE